MIARSVPFGNWVSISSNDGFTRAANVRIANADRSSSHCLRRNIKHLYPIKVNANSIEPTTDQPVQESTECTDTTSKENDDTSTSIEKRPCHVATATGELIRRIIQN